MTLGTFSETHLFRYLCNIYYVASIVLGPRDTMLNGTLSGCLMSVKWLPPLTHYRHSVNDTYVSYHHLEE